MKIKLQSKLLINNKDVIDYKNKSGIYRLQCNRCPRFYIGKTARILNIRVAEHLAAFRLKKDTFTFANYLILENHTFNFDSGIDLLHTNRGKFKLFYPEILEINRAQLNSLPILNKQLYLPNLPLLYPLLNNCHLLIIQALNIIKYKFTCYH